MAKYDVHALSGGQLVVDCEADLLNHLHTRFVVPLVAEGDALRPAARLNPVLTVLGKPMILLTQQAATVHVKHLGEPIASVADAADELMNALDMLISGF